MNFKDIFSKNQKYWDSRVESHMTSQFYQMDRFMEGWNSLCQISQSNLGNIVNKKILHLQCHFGQDTISMSRMGAEVTGIDFSHKAIKAAQELALDLNEDTKFIESSVYDLPQHLDEKYDIIFTSYGAICWLPDLDEWASIIKRYLKINGSLVIVEFHPTLYMFNFNNLELEYHYFNIKTYEDTIDSTYTGPQKLEPMKEYFWNHSLAEVFQSLKKFNIIVNDFNEYAQAPYQCFDNMIEIKPNWYMLDIKVRIPHVYSMHAVNRTS